MVIDYLYFAIKLLLQLSVVFIIWILYEFLYWPWRMRQIYKKYPNIKMAPKFAPFLGDIARMQENLSKNKSNVEHFIEDAIAEPEVDLRLVQYGPLSIINTWSIKSMEEFEAQVGTKIDRYSHKFFPIGNLVFNSFVTGKSNQNWEKRRKFVTKYLAINYCSKYVPMMIEWVDEVLKDYKVNQAVNLSEIPTKSAFRIICKILFGDEIFDKIGLLDYTCPYTGEKRKMTLEEFYPKIAKNVFDAYINPKGKIFSFLANRNLIDPYKTNIKNTYELYQVVGKFCENYSDSESIYQKMKSSGDFTDDECLNDTLILLFAGFDTTSHTVSSILCMLKRNPDKFEKLMEEMKIAKLNEIDRSEKRDYANIINGCDYLMHVVREGLRMEPPTFDSLVYEVVEDTQLWGVPLSKGTQMMLNCAYAQYSPLIWHEPRSFIPERFDPESKYFSMPSTDGSKKMRHPKSFSPFTFGMRNCAGQTLAKLKAKVILSRILQKIDYEIDDRFIKNTFIKFDMMSPEVLNGKILKFK